LAGLLLFKGQRFSKGFKKRKYVRTHKTNTILKLHENIRCHYCSGVFDAGSQRRAVAKERN